MADDSLHAFSNSRFIPLAPKIINTLWNSCYHFPLSWARNVKFQWARTIANTHINTHTHTCTRTHTDLVLSSIWCMNYAITTIWTLIKWTILHRKMGLLNNGGCIVSCACLAVSTLHRDRCFHISPGRRISTRLVQTSVTRCVAICGWPPNITQIFSAKSSKGIRTNKGWAGSQKDASPLSSSNTAL